MPQIRDAISVVSGRAMSGTVATWTAMLARGHNDPPRKILIPQKPTLRPWTVRPSLRRGRCRGQQGARDEIVPPPSDRQWLGGDLVHDRLHAVRRRHDQDGNTTSLGPCPSGCGCSDSFTWFRYRRACHNRRMADRDLWQSESRRWPWLAELSALAHIDVTGRNGAPAHRPNASGPLPLRVD
jgi:hypothetical protein